MKTKLKFLTGLVLLIFLTTSLTLVALAETSDEDEVLFSHEEVGLAPGGVGLLATIAVTSTADVVADDGQCTLREAITAANTNTASGATPGECAAGSGPDTITLQPSSTYILTSGQLVISSSITIVGSGPGSTTINGNANARIFRILPGSNATISGVTLTNGNDTKGGAIWNLNGTLVLSNTTISNNTAFNNGGGGILNEEGTLTVSNSAIISNTSKGGGGIFNDSGTVTINNTTISQNTSLPAAPANFGIGVGGGVANSAEVGDATLTINQSSITTNTAKGTGGGGINNSASGTNNTATVTLNQTLVSGNKADPDTVNFQTGFGGGIRNGFADPANGTTAAILEVNNSIVSGNEAVNGGGIGSGTESMTSTLTLKTTISNTTVSGNTTPNHNNGLLEGSGGGVVNVNGTLSLVNSTVSTNQANGTHSTGGGLGGGIFSGDLSRVTTLWLTNTTISGNTAVNGGQGVANYKGGGVTPTGNFKNSIIAGGCLNSNGTLTSHGNNLDNNNNNNCNLMVASDDITNTSTFLGSLLNNGGPTVGATGATAPMLTHAPTSTSSPILGAGDQTICAAPPISNFDQRSVARPAGDPNCDIGAYESDLEAATGSTDVYLPLVIKN